MADDIQGLPPGAVVKPIAPPTSAPTGGVEGLPADAVVSPIASQNTEPVQRVPEYNDPTKNPTGNPDYYPGEGAIARGATSAYRAMGGGALGDTNEEVKNRLKEIATHPVDKTLEFGKGVLDQQGELAAKAKDAWKKGDHVGAAAYALYYLLPGIGPSLAKSGEQLSSGDVAGGVGTAAGTALPAVAGEAATPESTVPKAGFNAATEQASREAAAKPSATAEEMAPKPESLKEAGQRVQSEAKAVKEAAGKNVGAAKESVQKSLPLKPASLIEKGGNLTKAADKVLQDTADSEQLAGAKDPDMADVRSMAQHLSEAKNAAGEPLSLDAEKIDSMKRAFDQKIDALQSKADAGGNATALRHVKNLKAAFLDDTYDAFEKYGDPESAKALRSASKEYARILDEQTSGPAHELFSTDKPETIPSKILNTGSRAQTATESLTKDMSQEGKDVLRDRVTNEIYRKSSLPDGTLDGTKARKLFYGLGDTAKALYGERLPEMSRWFDSISKETASRNKPTLAQRTIPKITQAVGTGVGATVGGAPGAIAGGEVGRSLGEAVVGKSGAVKIGISPTEKIVLSPTQATAARPLITNFLKAKAAGNGPAIAAAYNAIANPRKQNNQ